MSWLEEWTQRAKWDRTGSRVTQTGGHSKVKTQELMFGASLRPKWPPGLQSRNKSPWPHHHEAWLCSFSWVKLAQGWGSRSAYFPRYFPNVLLISPGIFLMNSPWAIMSKAVPYNKRSPVHKAGKHSWKNGDCSSVSCCLSKTPVPIAQSFWSPRFISWSTWGIILEFQIFSPQVSVRGRASADLWIIWQYMSYFFAIHNFLWTLQGVYYSKIDVDRKENLGLFVSDPWAFSMDQTAWLCIWRHWDFL